MPYALPDFLQAQFPGQDGLLQVQESGGEFQPVRRGKRHLGGGVQFQLHAGNLPSPFRQAAGKSDVLHDDPVRAGGIQVAQVGEGVRQLGGENERIHGHVPLHAVRVKETHQFRKGIQREVVCAQTGVETVQTEINGVCAIGYGGAGAVHVPGGSQQFGTQVSGPEGGKGHVVGSHGEKQKGCRGYWAVLRFSA